MEIMFDAIKPYLRFVRYLTLDSNSTFHPSTPYDARLFFTLDGNGIIEADAIAYPMRKNSLIIINSGVNYHLKSPDDFVSYLSINFDYTYAQYNNKKPIPPDIIKRYNSKNLINHVTFSDITELNEVFYIDEISTIEKKLIAMEKEYTRKINMHELKLSSCMLDVLIQCIRHVSSQSMVADDKETAGKIINYLQDNYNRILSNQQIADLFHYHPNYISNLIKQYTGLPLHQYIKSIRVAKAADMLAITSKSIQDIAIDCGFYDSSHFIKCFKELIGMTPKQYQNDYQ